MFDKFIDTEIKFHEIKEFMFNFFQIIMQGKTELL